MIESFFTRARLQTDDAGLHTSVDLAETNTALNQLMQQLQTEGYDIISVTPIQSGVGQFQYGPVHQNGINLTKWCKPPIGIYSYGFGYSYTSGFTVLAKHNALPELSGGTCDE